MDDINFLQGFHSIRCFIFDMDGVLTDGTLLVLNGEQQLRKMHVRDGLALQMAIRNGYRVVVISGSYSEAARERLIKLGVADIYMSVTDKLEFAIKYLEKHGLRWEEVLFMGDDLPDLALLKEAGCAACPADAAPEIRDICSYISTLRGGEGCVRDIIEKVLKVNGHWNFDTRVVSR